MKFRDWIDVGRETLRQWRAEDVTRMGAALAYYTAFSLVPMFVLTVSLVSLVFGTDDVESQVIQSIRGVIGQETAQTLRESLNNARAVSDLNPLSTLLSVGALAFGATGMFRHLKSSLNVIWNVPPVESSKTKGFLRDTALSLMMVLVLGLLLLFVIFANFVIFAMVRSLDVWFPQLDYVPLYQALALVILMLAAVLIFALVYKVLPDAQVTWRDVWAGAALTALLFSGGQFVIALILGSGSLETLYGTASILLIVLAWVYVSAHLVLLGAEFTQVYANRLGSRIVPTVDIQKEGSPMGR